MGKFKFVKRLELDAFGQGQAGGYLEFEAAGFDELEKIGQGEKAKPPPATETTQAKADRIRSEMEAAAKEVLDLLKAKFIGGKAWDGKALVDVTADDLATLPPEVIGEARKLVIPSAPDPNS